MLFEVLGPMRVTDERGKHPVVGHRQRIVLGTLLAYAGQPVAPERLAEFVWDGEPPGRAVATLRTYVARLRQGIGPEAAARVLTRDGGYLAEVGPGELDALAFEALCGEAGNAGRAADWTGAYDHAAGALALWRGTPLEDVPSQALRDAWLPRLDQQRVQVTEWRIEAELHLGRHESLVPQLRQLIAEHPLRERFRAQLMLALYRSGRQAEALAAYRDARTVLTEELGIEPGPELRRLHERILAGDADSDLYPGGQDESSRHPDGESGSDSAASRPQASPVSGGTPVGEVPRQLPTAAGHFTGRSTEMDLIAGLAEASRKADVPSGTVVISAIDGMAGIGKTALAVHVAHRLANRFPGGQLFIDLHGYTEGQPPRQPGEALGVLLRALNVPAAQIPVPLDECAAFYRQRLAGTRTLIVLDNALNEAQVRPLLPAAAGCLVLVTSRRRLKGLHDAHVVALDVLREADALSLLRAVIASARGAADDPDLAEIARLCGHLPLALRIVGALLRHRRTWTPRYLARLLRDEQQRLATLDDGDHDLRAVFGLSYCVLGDRQRLLFRRLALIPGPDLDAFAAAALLDADPTAAVGLLENLVDHNLLIEHAPGRYRLHDLVRAHARSLACDDPRADSNSALNRLLSYYAHAAQSASVLIARYPRPAPDDPAPASAPVLTHPEQARAWLRTDRENLQAACDQAREQGLDDHAVALAAGLAEILRTDGPLAPALALHEAAADTAARRGWPTAHATALTDLANIRYMTGNLSGAADTASRALEIYRPEGSPLGRAGALICLGRVQVLMGDFSGGIETATRALEIYRATGNRHGEAAALHELGRAWFVLGDWAGAEDAMTKALEIYRAIGNRLAEAVILAGLGRVRPTTGNLAGARDAATRALEIYRTIGNRDGEATALNELGRIRGAAGDFTGAMNAAAQALETFRAIGNRHGEATALADLGRARLATGDVPAARSALSAAMEIYRTIGSRSNEAWALNHYAATVTASGDLPRALTLYRRSLAMNRELNKPDDEALALEGIGECQLSAGQPATGTDHLRQALDIYERLGMTPDVERVRTRLADLAMA